jgi:hypothetical protein
VHDVVVLAVQMPYTMAPPLDVVQDTIMHPTFALATQGAPVLLIAVELALVLVPVLALDWRVGPKASCWASQLYPLPVEQNMLCLYEPCTSGSSLMSPRITRYCQQVYRGLAGCSSRSIAASRARMPGVSGRVFIASPP